MSSTSKDDNDLAGLDEALLLKRLKTRFSEGRIYATVADIILAMNPYKDQPELYTEKVRRGYKRLLNLNKLPSHIYVAANRAYRGIVLSNDYQCCLFSGESGAGKTEAAKHFMNQIFHLGDVEDSLKKKIVQGEVLLEAFGHAATSKNSNSSRFVKYTEVTFDTRHKMVGAKYSSFLFDSSRLSSSQDTSAFHVLYTLLGLENAAHYGLSLKDSYTYLNGRVDVPSPTYSSPHVLSSRAKALLQALQDLNCTAEIQDAILTVLAAILHLGNIGMDATKESETQRSLSFARVADMLGVSVERFQALCSASSSSYPASPGSPRGGRLLGSEQDRKKMGLDHMKDEVANAMYTAVFEFVLSSVNREISLPSTLPSKTVRYVPSKHLGLLDMFGFDSTQSSSYGFVQLAANVANEILLKFTHNLILGYDKDDYSREGVKRAKIISNDNEPLLRQLMGKSSSYTLYGLLVESSESSSGGDDLFFRGLERTYKRNSSTDLISLKSDDSSAFTVRHFAGSVVYSAKGFVRKMQGSAVHEVVSLLQKSRFPAISRIFLGKDDKPVRTLASIPESPTKNQNENGTPLFARFESLLSFLSSAETHLVLCIKANGGKKPLTWDDELVAHQISSYGLLPMIKARKECFAKSIQFADFIEKYRTLLFDHNHALLPTVATCKQILGKSPAGGYVIGKSKVFLSYGHLDLLNEWFMALHAWATVLQKVWRGQLARRRFRELVFTVATSKLVKPSSKKKSDPPHAGEIEGFKDENAKLEKLLHEVNEHLKSGRTTKTTELVSQAEAYLRYLYSMLKAKWDLLSQAQDAASAAILEKEGKLKSALEVTHEPASSSKSPAKTSVHSLRAGSMSETQFDAVKTDLARLKVQSDKVADSFGLLKRQREYLRARSHQVAALLASHFKEDKRMSFVDPDELTRVSRLVYEGMKNHLGEVRLIDILTVLKETGIKIDDDPRFENFNELVPSLPPLLSFEDFHQATYDCVEIMHVLFSGKKGIPEFAIFKRALTDLYRPFAIDILSKAPRRGSKVSVLSLQTSSSLVSRPLSLTQFSSPGSSSSDSPARVPSVVSLDIDKHFRELKSFAVAACTAIGRRARLGDCTTSFVLNELSAVLLYGLAMDDVGPEKVHQHVGREHSGGGYDDITVNHNNVPYNPLVQTGALVCCSLIKRELSQHERFSHIEKKLSEMIGGRPAKFNMRRYLALQEHIWKMKATCFFLLEKNAFAHPFNLDDTLHLYMQAMSFELDVESASIFAGTLANGGNCPITGQQIFAPEHIRSMLAIMHTCGMDKNAGQFAFNVGLPARNTSSRAIIVIAPGVLGLCSLSDDDDLTTRDGKGFRFFQQFAKRFVLGNEFSMKQTPVGHNYYVLDRSGKFSVNDAMPTAAFDPCKFHTESYEDLMYLFFTSARIGDVANLKRCLARGVSPDSQDYMGRTGIHIAAAAGQFTIIRALLLMNANKYVRDHFGKRVNLAQFHWHLVRTYTRSTIWAIFSHRKSVAHLSPTKSYVP